jgi:hypothetical protein
MADVLRRMNPRLEVRIANLMTSRLEVRIANLMTRMKRKWMKIGRMRPKNRRNDALRVR